MGLCLSQISTQYFTDPRAPKFLLLLLILLFNIAHSEPFFFIVVIVCKRFGSALCLLSFTYSVPFLRLSQLRNIRVYIKFKRLSLFTLARGAFKVDDISLARVAVGI